MSLSAVAQMRRPRMPTTRSGGDEVLAGRVAHDLRNILQIISGNLTILASKVGNDEAAMRYVERAMAGVDLGTRLAGSVLTREGRCPSAEATCLFSMLPTIESILTEAAGSGITVTVAMPTAVRDVAVDRTGLENVLINLAINARDAMEHHGTLRVDFNNEVYGGRPSVMMTVSDTGCGMTSDVMDRIFDAYFTTKGSNGSGLGLATVKRFAEECGGALSVDSSPGRGTTFGFRMPAAGWSVKGIRQ